MDAQLIRLECLKLAHGSKPGEAASAVIGRAKELEVFVKGQPEAPPAPIPGPMTQAPGQRPKGR